jgi:hypothetical protein
MLSVSRRSGEILPAGNSSMLVLSQRSGFAHERGRLPVEGRPMLRHRTGSQKALRKRNDSASASTADLHNDETAGDADTNDYAKHPAT